MNAFSLSLSYWKRRPLSTALNVLLLALGIASIVVLVLFGDQVQKNLERDAQGIDAVVGATGSPLQLVLSSVYHLDAPTGNISIASARSIQSHPAVASTIPLALGDSYRGYRIVGTERAYAELYNATLASGGWWDATYTVTVGHRVAQREGLAVGDTIFSTHGIGDATAHAHDDAPLTVSGIIAPTGTVIDRLVLTSVETVWAVHDDHGHGGDGDEHSRHGAGHDHEASDDHSHSQNGHDHERSAGHRADQDASPSGAAERPLQAAPPPGVQSDVFDLDREYTALLVQYRSPIAAATFPRFVNNQTDLQAAAPAFETARLTNLLGIGLDMLRAFGILLIVVAALSIFIALYNAMKERRYDLAVLRTLGASRGTLVQFVLFEGMLFAGAGLLVGLGLGHAATDVLASTIQQANQVGITGWLWVSEEWGLVALALGVGLVTALIPAYQAYQTDIADTLARA